MWNHFEEKLVADILKRSTVKFIIRCMCVCKSWRSLISSPNFISSHLRKSLASNNKFAQVFVFQQSLFECTECDLLQFDGSHQIHHFHSMLLRLCTQPETLLEIVGCVNGLMCFTLEEEHKDSSQFIIFNPEIGCFRSVPTPRLIFTLDFYVKGFGFDVTTLDYKIFLARSAEYVYIYSLNSNSWSSISCGNTHFHENDHGLVVFVNGCFHWVAYDSDDIPGLDNPPYIMVFDLKSETFGQSSLPEFLLGDLILTQYGESSIGIIQRIRFNLTHVWVMEKLGFDEWSWVKVAQAVWNGNRSKIVLEAQEVVGFRNKDELFIRFYNGALSSLNIKDKTVCNLSDIEIEDNDSDSESDFIFSVHTHVPSLVLLDNMGMQPLFMII